MSPREKRSLGGALAVVAALGLFVSLRFSMTNDIASFLPADSDRDLYQLSRKLADGGRTILLTVHQPSLQAYRLMDNVLYIADGEEVFYAVSPRGAVLMKPAAAGTGVIAGGAARVILEEAGVHDVLCKSLGSANHINVARATVAGLKALQRPDQIAARRGLPADQFVPKGLLDAYNERQKAGAAASAGSTE